MDRVIERASQLQERASAGAPGHALEDVKKVGEELDIDARFVDQALADLKAEEDRVAAERVHREAQVKKAGMVVAGVLAASLALGAVGAGGVRSAAGQADLARANLQTVVQRQTALVPQLLALAGGQAAGLADLQRAVDDAKDVDAQLRAADQLQLAMAQAVGSLPAAQNDSQSQQRLSLQHEMVGATNRVSTERRRYEEALAAWRQAASSGLGRLGVAVGLAPAPPTRK